MTLITDTGFIICIQVHVINFVTIILSSNRLFIVCGNEPQLGKETFIYKRTAEERRLKRSANPHFHSKFRHCFSFFCPPSPLAVGSVPLALQTCFSVITRSLYLTGKNKLRTVTVARLGSKLIQISQWAFSFPSPRFAWVPWAIADLCSSKPEMGQWIWDSHKHYEIRFSTSRVLEMWPLIFSEFQIQSNSAV